MGGLNGAMTGSSIVCTLFQAEGFRRVGGIAGRRPMRVQGLHSGVGHEAPDRSGSDDGTPSSLAAAFRDCSPSTRVTPEDEYARVRPSNGPRTPEYPVIPVILYRSYRSYPVIPVIPGHTGHTGHTRSYSVVPWQSTRSHPVIPGQARSYPVIPNHTRSWPVIPARTRSYPVIPGDTRSVYHRCCVIQRDRPCAVSHEQFFRDLDVGMCWRCSLVFGSRHRGLVMFLVAKSCGAMQPCRMLSLLETSQRRSFMLRTMG